MAEVGAAAPLVLILGGSRSGKSAVAERLVDQLADGAAVTYVATALLSEGATDAGPGSLAERVALHRARRPAHWTTVEAGADLAGAVAASDGPVLIDSLGPWTSATYPEPPALAPLLDALRRRSGPTVVVSDEVGLAVHPLTEAGRWFVDALGTVNQAVAAICPDVWLVVAGRAAALPDAMPVPTTAPPK
jgi:adenosyl cobinamide kinase/adenosyl cobinamide phosphate guanylyltransferase